MARLPVISGRKAVRAFERAGWRVSRREGSHVILTKTGMLATLSVPDHREVRGAH
jgi:predicted RNA binding protein YcfA (HicA-like mRNA interferase family)